MSNKVTSQEPLFYCRAGMRHHGPYTQKVLRKLIAAGLIDANSLIGEEKSKVMLPLGSSRAARCITYVARFWRRSYSPLLYSVWMIFMPLFSAGVAGIGISHSNQTVSLLLFALFLGMLGLSLWLFRSWQILLAEELPHPWRAALYAFPMALPVVNLFWIWIGYMKLPKYWRKFKQRHNLPEANHYSIYYVALILFYLMVAGWLVIFILDVLDKAVLFTIVGVISWLWFGVTMLSMFLTDQITMRIIKSKLSNLAFGALRFCADVNYDMLHKAVMTLAFRAKKSMAFFCGALLLISWLAGGWVWLNAVDVCREKYASQQSYDFFLYSEEIKDIFDF